MRKKGMAASLSSNHEYNNDFDKLINDAAHGRLRFKGDMRPAYYGTSICPDESQYDGRRLYAKSKGTD